jgi:hypothetical protein
VKTVECRVNLLQLHSDFNGARQHVNEVYTLLGVFQMEWLEGVERYNLALRESECEIADNLRQFLKKFCSLHHQALLFAGRHVTVELASSKLTCISLR